MTNQEKYTTAVERDDAFYEFCSDHNDNCDNCPLKPRPGSCRFEWLFLSADDESEVINDR